MIDGWFPTLIYNDTLNFQHRQYLVNKAKAIYSQTQGHTVTKWACDTYNTVGFYDHRSVQDTVVLSLIELLRTKVHEFGKNYGINLPIETLYCKDFWFNLAEPGAYQEYHQHTRSHFSVSYYLSVLENCGKIRFRSIEAMTDMYTLPVEGNLENFASKKTCAYEPVDNLLLIFRSNVPHMVEKNHSEELRISISANFEYA